jgi:hypothetical protein
VDFRRRVVEVSLRAWVLIWRVLMCVYVAARTKP